MRLSLTFLVIWTIMIPMTFAVWSFWGKSGEENSTTTTTDEYSASTTTITPSIIRKVKTTKKSKYNIPSTTTTTTIETTVGTTTSDTTTKAVPTTTTVKFNQYFEDKEDIFIDDNENDDDDMEEPSVSTQPSPIKIPIRVPINPIVPVENNLPVFSVSLVDKSILDSMERIQSFKMELKRSELEVAYVVMLNLQSKVTLIQGNLSHLLGNDCRSIYWDPLTPTTTKSATSQHENLECLTSPTLMNQQILDFEKTVEINLKFRHGVQSFQSKFGEKLLELHETYENALRMCSSGMESLDSRHEPSLPFNPVPTYAYPSAAAPEPELKKIESIQSLPVQVNGNGNGLTRRLTEIEGLPSSSIKITKFKDLISEIRSNGLQNNSDILRVASFIKNTKCRADARTLRPEFPTLVEQVIWSEKLSLRSKKGQKTFKLVINTGYELTAIEVTSGSEDKETYGQDWRFSPVLGGNSFVLFNENRRFVIGAGIPANGSVSQDGNGQIRLLIENTVGRDVVLMPKDFFWKLHLSCPQPKKECNDNSLLLSLVNHQYQNLTLDIDYLGSVSLREVKGGGEDVTQFFVVPVKKNYFT